LQDGLQKPYLRLVDCHWVPAHTRKHSEFKLRIEEEALNLTHSIPFTNVKTVAAQLAHQSLLYIMAGHSCKNILHPALTSSIILVAHLVDTL
jgi:hypothetical protein